MKTKSKIKNQNEFCQLIAESLRGRTVLELEKFMNKDKSAFKTIYQDPAPGTKIEVLKGKHPETYLVYKDNEKEPFITIRRDNIISQRLEKKEYVLGTKKIENKLIVFLANIDPIYLSQKHYLIEKAILASDIRIKSIKRIIN